MNLLPLAPVECNDIIERVMFMTTKYVYSPESCISYCLYVNLSASARAWKEYTYTLTSIARARGHKHSCVT